jgi:hypothetical protein
MDTAKHTVSAHTLARFFGFLPQRKMYPNTLRIICNYLGFEHIEAYQDFIDQTHNRSLFRSNGMFQNEIYSAQSFELAVQLMDLNDVQKHLDCIDFTHEKIEDIAHLTGFLVRNSTQQDTLLELFTQTSNGRRLYYERFVDEDDPNGYFSNALQKHYSTCAKNSNSKLFYFCYLIANASYQNKPVAIEWIKARKKEKQNLDFNRMHFHEISRVFETQILVDFQAGVLSRKSLVSMLDEVLHVIQPMASNAKAWVLARVIKALAFADQLFFSMKNSDFHEAIRDVHKQTDVGSIGELIVQLIFFRFSDLEDREIRMPMSLKSHYFQNEYNTRLSAEAATKYLFGLPEEQQKIASSLHSFSMKTGTAWVMNVIKN